MKHSSIVGGSTAKRVIRCPGSVTLATQAPPRPPSKYAEEGTLLHEAMAQYLYDSDKHQDIRQGLTEAQREKFDAAIMCLDELDPHNEMEMWIEANVHFGDLLPDVFGSCDLLGRMGDRVIILDWKFGDGVPVQAEENEQLMFYTAAAMRTPQYEEVFKNAREIECIIVQPPFTRRWVTGFDRIRQFERELLHAVKTALKPNAPLSTGEHCRFCPAKPLCPEMTGEAARVLAAKAREVNTEQLSAYLEMADRLEHWITDVREFATELLEQNISIPRYKLVAKRGVRKWVDEAQAKAALMAHLPESEVMESTLISPAQAEKKLKKLKLTLPEGQVVSVSSGNTMASEDDPRPPVLLLGQQLTKALGKLV